MSRRLCIVFAILALSLFLAVPLAAQGGVSTEPVQITVAGVRGQTETRTLLLRTSTALSGLRAATVDLPSVEGDTVFPAEAIKVSLETDSIAANGLLTVPVTFDFRAAPSGKFAGTLLIAYADGNLPVAMNVTVKDPPWVALAVLILGIALGIGVSTYRAQGRPRDEVLVRLGQIRTQMKLDQELQELGTPFQRRIESGLVDTEVALEGQRWNLAQEAVLGAEDIWLRWRRGRPDWLVQLEYYDSLVQKLQLKGENIYYINQLSQSARDAYRDTPELGGPEDFRKSLEPLAKQFNAFATLETRIDQLGQIGGGGQWQNQSRLLKQRLYAMEPAQHEDFATLQSRTQTVLMEAYRTEITQGISSIEQLSGQLPESQVEPWLAKVQEFQERVASLDPEDSDAYQALVGDVMLVTKQVQALSTQELGEMPTDKAAFSFAAPQLAQDLSVEQDMPELLTGLPQIRVRSIEGQTAVAGRRLRWFAWVSYAITVLLLAFAGFAELYSARPEFGASGIGDYFALLAWGFGAEATRAAIADMFDSWGSSASPEA